MTESRLWSDLQQVRPGDRYFCVSRSAPVAHRLVIEASRRGAIQTLSMHDIDEPGHQRWPSSRKEQREKIDAFYGPLPENPKIIAITGTNGKSSTVSLLQASLEMAGYPTTMIGTLGVRSRLSESHKPTGLTTPDYADLRGHIAQAHERGDLFVVMEASSHALSQHRMGSIPIFVAGATAVTCDDHQEYHGSAYAYIKAKGELFAHYRPQLGVLPCPHPLWFWTQGIAMRSYVPLPANAQDLLSVQWQWPNIQLAEEILRALQISAPHDRGKWVQLAGAHGRFESYPWSDHRTAWVDFAHTPHAMTHLFAPWARGAIEPLWVIFGCGGERDRAKRPEMLQIALKYASMVIITADNPRYEPFAQITADILQNQQYSHVKVLENRAEAIEYAARYAPAHAQVFILGKGHEKTQEVQGRSLHHSDRQEAQRYAHT